MTYPILNKHEFHGYKFNDVGDLAIVYESPYKKSHAPHPITSEIFTRISSWGIGKRLASIYVVCPYHRAVGKDKYPLLELRKGWKRVIAELATISPSVKRVLLVSQSTLLTQVVMPGVPGLQDTHGTIFTLDNGLEVVPTWQKVYGHMEVWRDRDISRWINLVKGDPLSYHTHLGDLYFSDAKEVVVDLETTGLDSTVDTITLLGVQWSDTDRALIKGDENIQGGIALLTDMIREGTHVTFHNGQFDLGFLTQEFRDAVIDHNAVHCTLMRSRARGELANTLKHLGNHYTNRPGNYAYAKPGVKHKFDYPPYVCEDLQVTWELSKLFSRDGDRPIVKQMEAAIVMAAEQTLAGSFVDKSKLDTLFEDGKENIALWESICVNEYGVHPGKTKEMVAVLLQRGYELTKRTPSGNFALDEDVCEEFGLFEVLQYRKAVKLDSSFVGKIKKLLRDDGTLPHNQKMMGADTGRTTMSNFNHQQAARKGPVRGLITSRFRDIICQ